MATNDIQPTKCFDFCVLARKWLNEGLIVCSCAVGHSSSMPARLPLVPRVSCNEKSGKSDYVVRQVFLVSVVGGCVSGCAGGLRTAAVFPGLLADSGLRVWLD